MALVIESEEEKEIIQKFSFGDSFDPVLAAIKNAHEKLFARLGQRVELHLELLVALIQSGLDLAPSSTLPDNGVHNHIACYLGIEAILKERQFIYEHLTQGNQNHFEPQGGVRSAVKRVISIVKGLNEVMQVHQESAQIRMRYLIHQLAVRLALTLLDTQTNQDGDSSKTEEFYRDNSQAG